MVMAIIYTTCGRFDEAIDELDFLLSLRTAYTVYDVKHTRYLDPLREHPRYKGLIARYEAEIAPN